MELENIMLSEVRFRKKVACFLIMWKIDPKANISIIIYTYIYIYIHLSLSLYIYICIKMFLIVELLEDTGGLEKEEENDRQ
jgi:hypothetical protein